MPFAIKNAVVLLFVFAVAIKSFSQSAEKAEQKKEHPFFLNYQPLVLFEVPRGGFKIGAEKIVASRIGIGLDVACRMINYTESDRLQIGEKESRTGFQVQPEIKWYFKNGRSRGGEGFNFRNAISLRLGYARYNDAFTNWTTIVDASGNRYQKLSSYNRIQQNLDASVMLSRKIYFSPAQAGWGCELFTGLGARQKIIDYKNAGPELDVTVLRQNDESAIFSLLRESGYPLFHLGARVFYRF